MNKTGKTKAPTLPGNYKIVVGSRFQSWRLQRLLHKYFGVVWGVSGKPIRFTKARYLMVQFWEKTSLWGLAWGTQLDYERCPHETITSNEMIAKCKALIKSAKKSGKG